MTDNPFEKLQANPFRQVLEEGRLQKEGPGKAVNLTKERQLRTIQDMKIADPEVLKRAPKVAALTVNDLEDLAQEFSGVPSRNPAVAELSLEDLQEIEAVFYDFKISAAKDLARHGGDLAAVDVSCCCCTPCCCCAATDMSETADLLVGTPN